MDQTQSFVIIDTDVLINFLDTQKAGFEIVQSAFVDLNVRNVLLCISIITFLKMLQGSKSNQDKRRITKQLEVYEIINITDEISNITKNLIVTYSSSHGLMMADAFIAATALYFNFPLFTFNKKDFKFIKNLELYQPS